MNDGDRSFSESYPKLSTIRTPDDLKAMSSAEVETLAEEIRSYLINQVKENGGHLASNLGVVEMTLAIHRVFSTPHDHIIFDEGHQSYVHKLLTGRQEQFPTLRQSGGLSGFPKRCESEHDCFGTGHSSTSLSAALGFAETDRLSGSDAYTVCVVGDGAYTGGMIHEALNNCRKKLRLIIILNENEMSISKNIGRFAKELSHLRATKGYFTTKRAVTGVLSAIPFLGKWMVKLIKRVKRKTKDSLYGSNLFENLGLSYFGPADGNDEAEVERLLMEAKAAKGSCVVHIKTKKGKGYADAEAKPDKFHGIPASCACTGDHANSFSHQMGVRLCKMAQRDARLCAITAAMADGTGLDHFRGAYPTRFFDVGIAEPHAVTFAAGMAANGYHPAVAIYSTFLQRAYDNIIHDVALQNLPVVFFVDRAGMNPSDGPTHYGVFDVAFLSQIPNLTLYTPITSEALANAMEAAFRPDAGVCAIRYPNGQEDAQVVETFYAASAASAASEIGVRASFSLTGNKDQDPEAVIVTHGRIVSQALQAAKTLAEQGKRVGILLLERLTPYTDIAKRVAGHLPRGEGAVLFLEEEIRAGGMGMLLSDALKGYDVMQNKTTSIMALEDPFCTPAEGQTCLEAAGLDADSIVSRLQEMLG